MPSETRFVKNKEVSKTGALVIPLDKLRSLDNVTATVVSGVSGLLYTIASGKTAYITQAQFTVLSAAGGLIQLHDARGSGLCSPVFVDSGTTVWWNPRPTACGPITSGITVQTPRFGGSITLLVHLDPERTE